MATVKFERVVSYSSEDPKYPAENLLKFGNKWKCKSPGEANATVILQLDQLLVIESIDIGNEHSAFIHVLVGRAASDDYETLQQMGHLQRKMQVPY
ncbi:DNA repair protein XRCC1 [Gryllus bimaculatus]|nr:DNA repair protein XRCC1 [Gryllus bimaculatus]